jgi:hypothetical protein
MRTTSRWTKSRVRSGFVRRRWKPYMVHHIYDGLIRCVSFRAGSLTSIRSISALKLCEEHLPRLNNLPGRVRIPLFGFSGSAELS